MHYLSSDIAPMGDQDPPECRMSGDIPVITLGEYPTRFQIALGNHNDPAGYLRQFAANLLDFADEIAAPAEVTA